MPQTIACPANQVKGPYAVSAGSIVSLAVTSGGSAYLQYAVAPAIPGAIYVTWPNGVCTTVAPETDQPYRNVLVLITCTAGTATLNISDPDNVNLRPSFDWWSLGQVSGSGGAWTRESEGYTGQVSFGANMHYGDAIYGNYFASPYIELVALGSLAVRDAPGWLQLQPTSISAYNWNASGPVDVDQLFAAAAAGGQVKIFNMSLGISKPSGIAFPYVSGANLTAWQNFVTEVATHYDGLGYSKMARFSLGNEWLGVITAADGYTMLAAMYDAAKAVSTSIKIGAPVGIDMDWTGGYSVWTDQFLATNWAAKCDYWDHHVYWDSANAAPQITPEQMVAHLKLVHSKVLRNNPGIPITISETGWYTETGARAISRALQAQYYTRYPFLLRALPNVECILFYELRDTSAVGYGMWHDSSTPKPSVAALTNALSFVNGASTAVRFSHANGTTICVAMDTAFGKEYAIWDTSGIQTLSINIITSGVGTLTIKAMIDGTSITQSLVSGVQTKKISISQSAIVLKATEPVTGLPLEFYIDGML